jgi:flagellar basal-body rod protein FlgC
MFDALDIGASGLTAQRTRLDLMAQNISNAGLVTYDAQGKANPYRRRYAVIAAGQSGDNSKPGVHVKEVKQDMSPFIPKWDEDKHEYVMYPNVDPTIEFVNSIEAQRAYEANVTMMEVSKAMINASLRLLA